MEEKINQLELCLIYNSSCATTLSKTTSQDSDAPESRGTHGYVAHDVFCTAPSVTKETYIIYLASYNGKPDESS